jgi:L-ascorbate peroxidase
MHSSASLLTPNTAFQVAIKAPKTSRRSIHVRCAAPHESQERPSRRALLVGASSIAALPLLTAPPADAKLVERVIPAKNLSASQKKDLLNDLQSRATRELSKVLTTADASAALRLLLHDAATYDAKNKTGGVNGSIVMSEELKRPENADLKEIVGKLAKARDAIIASQNPAQAPLSWADTIVLAVKVTQENAWVNVLRERNPTNADYLAGNFGESVSLHPHLIHLSTVFPQLCELPSVCNR